MRGSLCHGGSISLRGHHRACLLCIFGTHRLKTPTKTITKGNMTEPETYDLLARNTVIKKVMDEKGIIRKK